MTYTNMTEPRNKGRLVFAALLAATALVAAPLVVAPASAADPTYTISGSWSTSGAASPPEYSNIYNLETGDSTDVAWSESTYTTGPLSPGTYKFNAYVADSDYAYYAATVRVSSDNVTHNVVFEKWAYIRGSVSDFNNIGSSGVKLSVYEAASSGGAKTGSTVGVIATSVVDGKPTAYELAIPPGTYKVGFVSSGYSGAQYFPGVDNFENAEEITLAAEETVSYVDAIFPLSSNEALRLGGSNRYDTSVKITQRFAPGAERLYIATGAGFADGLSAVPAAARYDSPLLLTATGSLPSAVAAEVERLNPGQIVVVGGTGVVSENVVNQLNAIFPGDASVMRLEGSNRYVTSRAIARDAFSAGADVAFIATGANFPDALAASPAAAHLGGPVILVNGDSNRLDSATKALLVELGVTKVKIAGGSAVVSAGIKADLATVPGVTEVIRYAGGGRETTAVAINQLFPSSSTAFIATSTGFADSLGGAALAGFKDAPLYLSPVSCVPSAAVADIARLGSTSRIVLGGTGVLSKNVLALTSC